MRASRSLNRAARSAIDGLTPARGFGTFGAAIHPRERGVVMGTLEEQLDYFIENQDDLVSKHRGKVLILRDRKVADVFDTVLDAYLHAEKHYETGTYAIQECEPGPEAYTVSFTSPLALAEA